MRLFPRLLLPGLLALAGAVCAAGLPRRYAVVLQEAPLARQVLPASRSALATPAAAAKRQALLKQQEALKSLLRERKVAVSGSIHTLANAVFVMAAEDRVAELRALPGVAAVIPMPTLRRKLNRALDLVNASGGWSAVGGVGRAGAGVKIAVLDTGIDETHPGFQDPALAMPPGFPKSGNADDATHATNKIIAVRSFVSALAQPDGAPEFTRPDDLSARDRVGHGTAVAMIAAGVSHQSPLGTISGVAPKAWLGSYKIFGSPGVNDSTTADVVLQALEAAFNDGMDVALLSAGDMSAMWAASDQGATCGLAAGTPCDPLAGAVSAAGLGGMVVVLPAGNDGDLGWNTINTPGDVSAALTVGATANAHTLASTLWTPEGGKLQARLGDGPQLLGALSAPLLPVSSIDATEHGCERYPAGSLDKKLALVSTGECSQATKVMNAQDAGAVGILIFNQPSGNPSAAEALIAPTGLVNTGIPSALISAASGAFLKSYIAAHAGAVMTLDPATGDASAMDAAPGDIAAAADSVAHFSSRGPNAGDFAIKPDLVAPGASIYTAAQNYDPNGDLYSASRYIGVDGTSFAAAFAAGAAALVRQAHPGYSAGQIKSALTNTASAAITDFDANGNPVPARSIAMGAGKLNLGPAIASTLTLVPATVSFGVADGKAIARTVVVTNTGSAAANVRMTVRPRDTDSIASVTVTPASFTLAPGQSASVSIALGAGLPAPGLYEGVIAVEGVAVPVQIPYLYAGSDRAPANLIPLLGRDFVTESASAVDLAFRVVDRYGIPMTGLPVRFAPSASVYAATPTTDNLGIAEAYLRTEGTAGNQMFSADLLGNAGRLNFSGRTRQQPEIAGGGVVDAASFQVPKGFAPGSYLTIFGTGLSESYEAVRTPYLPVSLAGVSVSFDVPTANIHVPGRLYFVSGGQISVQVPWELAGQSLAVMKVTLANSSSKDVRVDDNLLGTFQTQTVQLPIASFAPAFFEYPEPSSGKPVAAAMDENNALIGPANPARRGHVVQFFVNGLGPVAPGTQPASGEMSPGTPPLATTQTTPVVTIGGQPATVQFSGLAPLLVGLYQVNAIVPPEAVPGLQPAVISIGGVTSRATMLSVQ